jgi:hypothetical protein
VERKDGETRSKKWVILVVGGGLVGLLALVGLVSAINPHMISSVVAKLTRTTKPSPEPPTHPDAGVYSTPHGPLDLKGTGSQETKQFTAGADWDLEWSYDCSNLKGQPDRLVISILNSTGKASVETPPVIEYGTKGSGVKHYRRPGPYFLMVMSRCTWHVTTR